MELADSVWIVAMWDNDILNAFNLRPGQRFVLGDAPGGWAFPNELLSSASVALVDYTEAPPRWCPTGVPLEPGKRMEAEFGRFRVFATVEKPVAEPSGLRRLRAVDEMFAYFGGSILAVSAFLIAACYAVPELTEVDQTEPESELLYLLQQWPGPGDPRDIDIDTDPEPEPPVTAASEVFPIKHGLLGNSRCGGEIDMGTDELVRNKRYGIEGPRDNADPHIGRERLQQKREALGDRLPKVSSLDLHLPVDGPGPIAPWGRDENLGTDEVGARGNMWGDEIGEAEGDIESMGIAHLDGGETKSIDVERPSSVTRPARVVHTQGQVKGPLALSTVEHSLVAKLQGFRECYRADPASHGNQEGQLDIDFTVDANGIPDARRISHSAHVAPQTASCILEHIRTASFSKADSASEVHYPLLLVPGEGSATQPVERVILAPPIARSNDPVVPCGGIVHHRSNTQGGCKR